MLLQDRIAIVSGIGPGLGRDVALSLAREGAHVALAARSRSHLEPVAKEVEALGRRALCVETDITSADACRNLVASTRDAFGRIDVLVNNAYHPGSYDLFEKDDLANWRAPLEVNLFGTLQLTQAAVPVMKEQGRGSIVMINSMIVRKVLPTMAGYAASKGALLAATQGLARELGPHGIRVNSVLPGYIWGPNLEAYFKFQADQRGVDPQRVYDEVASQIALGKIPDSREISGAVVFFASDLSQVVTGQSLDVNGGHEMR
jgi:NAD(P)-dependent dehydrogenase (short-subunit alcohol dehydrogenase family)